MTKGGFTASALVGPLLVASATLAVFYGIVSRDWYAAGVPTLQIAALKTSSIALIVVLAALRAPALAAGALLLGAVGDFLLALRTQEAFAAGAIAFLCGHLAYSALFIRRGYGIRAALGAPWRAAAIILVPLMATALGFLLWPREQVSLVLVLALYAAALCATCISALTLPPIALPAMLGALLFFASDAMTTVQMFKPLAQPQAAAWCDAASWLTYWAGQALLFVGSSRLPRTPRN